MSAELDDLDALRKIVDALAPFEAKDQERLLRWAREKIGLELNESPRPRVPEELGSIQSPAKGSRPKDIRTFVETKNPQSDNQFAAAVAYYYRFEAPEAERKTDITAEDLQDATRKAGRERLTYPGQTLLNAHGQGYLDKVERGRYALSTVGENLVAMALPQSGPNQARRAPKPKRRSGASKKQRATAPKTKK